ncbi:MAG: electron transport complex subunit RsxC [Candidatus Omnitrophica bacterium]|nr:electron transport complex subunit RsxC [Candidatus Omnitrophota bacterium]
MVRLNEQKHSTENKPLERFPAPVKVYIPLSQHLGKICNPLVNIKDQVSLGQKIASVEAHVYAPIHASVSGKVIAIQEWPHPVLGRCKTIVIENDGLDMGSGEQGTRESVEVNRLTAQQIRDIVLEAGVVGMGGASFPTHIKLNPQKPLDTLIINGAECEPYLTCDYRLMVEKTQEIVKGIELAVKCVGAKKVIIAIEDNKPDAIKAFNYGLRVTDYELRILKSAYPQGGEKQLIKNVLGKEVTSGKLPFDVGVVVHNVGTIHAIYEAVYLKKPLYERAVTVAGSCISNPKNLLVRIGTPIRELVDSCGPLKEIPSKVIIGGPMMGIAQFSEMVPVIKSSTGVLLLNSRETREIEEESCIRCGACVRECPVGLMPTLINLSSQKEMWPQTKKFGALDCIECGICSYVCPSNIRLIQSIKRAKLEVLK